jgi:hypothetical protein
MKTKYFLPAIAVIAGSISANAEDGGSPAPGLFARVKSAVVGCTVRSENTTSGKLSYRQERIDVDGVEMDPGTRVDGLGGDHEASLKRLILQRYRDKAMLGGNDVRGAEIYFLDAIQGKHKIIAIENCIYL